MASKHHHHHHHHHHEHDSRRSSLGFIDRIEVERILAPLLPDARDRGLVTRCLLDEGPHHHRGANFVLIKLLADLAGPLEPMARGTGTPVPMHLPPHVKGDKDSVYPLLLPTDALGELAKDAGQAEAMTDCLLDGPPQHFLANVVMVILIEAIRRRLQSGSPVDIGSSSSK